MPTPWVLALPGTRLQQQQKQQKRRVPRGWQERALAPTAPVGSQETQVVSRALTQ